ncbi:MAG: NUDIX domain-containing protein, partial [Candidatus Sumerlaeia bacterium]|nr:NUDIX domain-containing protein [Candidatus Sumerlaeia bacterium]
LSRFYAYDVDVSTTQAKRELKEYATDLLDPRSPGDFNQAMMELGALVCLPGNPNCGACPWMERCAAWKSGDPGSYPVKARKPELEPVREAAILLQQEGLVYLVKRPENVSFGGMWELPRVRCGEEEESLDAATRAGRELLGLEVRVGSPIKRIKHTVMRNRITLTVYKVRSWVGDVALGFHEDGDWFPLEDWEHLPKSTTQAKICHFLLGGGGEAKSVTPADDDQPTFL